MSLSDVQFEFAKDIAYLIMYCVSHEIKVTFGECYRTEYQQAEYLRAGKSKTKNSLHLQRLACDLNFFINGELKTDFNSLENIGLYFKGLNPKNDAGMFWKFYDPGHFQRSL